MFQVIYYCTYDRRRPVVVKTPEGVPPGELRSMMQNMKKKKKKKKKILESSDG